jgi:broad specificity phosphatase PhoE
MNTSSITTLVIARHGEADWNAAGRWQGLADRPLTAHGRSQARTLAEQIAHLTFDAAYASDLSRALETARLAIQARQTPIEARATLRERDFGAWDGLTDNEIASRWPDAYDRWQNGESSGADDAETYASLEIRVASALREISEAHRGGTVFVVTHSGPMVVAQSLVAGVPFTDATARRALPEVATCGYICIEHDAGWWRASSTR